MALFRAVCDIAWYYELQKDLLKRIIIENREFINRIELTDRELSLEKNGNYVFTGLRRAGKTYSLYQTAKTLVAQGLKPEQILFIGFEDERLAEFKSGDFNLLMEAYRELYDARPILFFDEIQNIDGWEKFARRLADNKYRVFVTGSNAKMLSREIAGTLGGRFLVKEIFPLSFYEFLTMNGSVPEKNWEYGEQRFTIRNMFDEYLRFGGLPELNQFVEKKQWLSDLYRKIYYGDIILRYKVRNDYALKLLVKKLAESVMTEISYNRIRHIINSSGAKIGTSTVIDYIGYLEDSYLIHEATNAAAKFTDRETDKKYYFADNGVLSLFLENPENRLLENIVACDLVRRGRPLRFIRDRTETDFIVPNEKTAIQVCMTLADAGTQEREIASMLQACSAMKVERYVIITMDENRIVKYNDARIEIVPIWRWLLR